MSTPPERGSSRTGYSNTFRSAWPVAEVSGPVHQSPVRVSIWCSHARHVEVAGVAPLRNNTSLFRLCSLTPRQGCLHSAMEEATKPRYFTSTSEPFV